ncbi:MAG: DUF86 domain-containing protein [Nanoarchaeota archaeon]|nr:DUF86 domain-containing protein [Nanoarchaeota archaeon]
MNRIEDKILGIEQYIIELGGILPDSLKKYESNIEKKAACERYFEKIIESAVDLAFLLIKSRNLTLPEDDIDAFSVLQKSKIITEKTANKLKDAKRIRNIIIHQYSRIDDAIVFKSIKEELKKDIKDYIKEVNKWLK